MTSIDGFLTHHESGHFRFRPAYTTTRPMPTDLLVIWNMAGTMAVDVADTTVQVGPGQLVSLPPRLPHRYRATTEHGWEWLWLHVGGSAVDELDARLAAVGRVLPLGDDPLIRSRFTEVIDAAAGTPEPRSPAAQLHLDSCAFSLFGLILRRFDETSGGAATVGTLTHLTTWVRDNLERDLRLDDLVRASGWSAAQLTRLTRRQLGAAPMQYVARVRMREASRLLADSDLTVSEIARRVGFADPLHFSRRFRQVTGTSPSQTRRR